MPAGEFEIYSFHMFRLVVDDTGEPLELLRCDDSAGGNDKWTAISIQRLTLRVLLCLVKCRTEGVGRAETYNPGPVGWKTFLPEVWRGVNVQDGNLKTHIELLRKALKPYSLIKTVHRIGYKMSVDVGRATESSPAAPQGVGAHDPAIIDFLKGELDCARQDGREISAELGQELARAHNAYDMLRAHLSPASMPGRLAAASDLVRARKIDEASHLYDDVIAAERDEFSKRKKLFAAILYQRARLHQLKFQHPEALAMLEEAITLEPGNSEYLIAAGYEVLFSDAQKAESLFTRAVEAYRRKSQGSEAELALGLQHLGNLFASRGAIGEAVETWIEAIELLRFAVEKFPEWNRRLANLLIPTGNILGAVNRDRGEAMLKEAIGILNDMPDTEAPVDALFARLMIGQIHSVHGPDDACAIYTGLTSDAQSLIGSGVDSRLLNKLLTLVSGALAQRARIEFESGDVERSLMSMKDSVETGFLEMEGATDTLERKGTLIGLGARLEFLGDIENHLGHTSEAAAAWQKAVETLEQIGDDPEQVYYRHLSASILKLADSLSQMCECELAEQAFSKAVEVCRRSCSVASATSVEDRHHLAYALNRYGVLLTYNEKWDESEGPLTESLQIRREMVRDLGSHCRQSLIEALKGVIWAWEWQMRSSDVVALKEEMSGLLSTV